MKTVKALVAFSNGVISMEQYEVRELPTDMANDLIAAGICVEAGGSGGVLVVNATESGHDIVLDKTWQEIYDAMLAGGAVVKNENNSILSIKCLWVSHGGYSVSVSAENGTAFSQYVSTSASGYPALLA